MQLKHKTIKKKQTVRAFTQDVLDVIFTLSGAFSQIVQFLGSGLLDMRHRFL